MPSLAELLERRAFECRLTPDRALETLDEAEAFLRDRGLLTRTTDSALPSLFEACHEPPYAEGRGGFAQWPKTKWWWGGALEERPGVYAPRIHRGKTLFVTGAVTALADPLARAELARLEAAGGEPARLLRHLAEAGPSGLGDLQLELGLAPRDLKRIRGPLERVGAIVNRRVVDVTAGGGHDHTSELARWDQVFPESPGAGGLEELVVAAVRTAVVAPEREAGSWFSWRAPADLVDRLVGDGRLVRPGPGFVAAG
ncbi:MAG: hypothetical protein ABR521_11460 [Gaiellaceae bacterium]